MDSLDKLENFAHERIGILSNAEARSSLKGGRNPWSHRKVELELLLEKLAEIRESGSNQ